MPIQVPNLDDRNYDQLVKETDVLIARYFPEYVDMYITDPAVAINELFCYLFDLTMYQLNRVTPDARSNFAALLGIDPVYGRPPEEALRLALAKLSRMNRAVTPGDIEAVLIAEYGDNHAESKTTPQPPKPKLLCGFVERAWVRAGKSASEPLCVSVVQSNTATSTENKREEDLRTLYRFLRAHSPIGTQYLLNHAPVLQICVSAEIVKRQDSTINSDNLVKDIGNKLEGYIHPLHGGDDGVGWPFDTALSRGDIFKLIEGMPGVDHVRSLYIKEAGTALYSDVDTLAPKEGGLLYYLKSGSEIIVR